jgi:uncharacterized protein YoaH (UPF0181 family)
MISLALIAAGGASSGGATAFVVKKLQAKSDAQRIPTQAKTREESPWGGPSVNQKS